MLRPLAIGLPLIFVIVIAFVAVMNFVPVESPYFIYGIIGYVVLFPAALIYTIVATIKNARRVIAGGDVSLRERGEQTMATVAAARALNMTARVGAGRTYRLHSVRLKLDNRAPDISTTNATSLLGEPAVGDRVPVYLDRDNAKNFFVDWAQSTGAQRLPEGSEISQIVSQIKAAAGDGGMQVNVVGNGGATSAGADIGRLVSQIKAAAMDAGAQRVEVSGTGAHYAAGPEPMALGSDGLEGRARIEGLKPYPDGTYDLDLYVTPRGKSSYRVAARVPVPAGTGLLQRGQTLKVRIDPDISSRVQVVWD